MTFSKRSAQNPPRLPLGRERLNQQVKRCSKSLANLEHGTTRSYALGLGFPAHRGAARLPGVCICQGGGLAELRRRGLCAMLRGLGHLSVAGSGTPRAPGPGAPTWCLRMPGGSSRQGRAGAVSVARLRNPDCRLFLGGNGCTAEDLAARTERGDRQPCTRALSYDPAQICASAPLPRRGSV